MIRHTMKTALTYVSEFYVLLDGKRVGVIRELYDMSKPNHTGKPGPVIGYRYHPKGDKTGGDLFPTLAACQHSLESN